MALGLARVRAHDTGCKIGQFRAIKRGETVREEDVMTASERKQQANREHKQLQAMWRQLAKMIGAGRVPPQHELDARYREVMRVVREGEDA
jgi:hypothetical protein